MPGGIVLAGGDEFRPGCEEMDSTILKATGAKPPKVLIVPTAAVPAPEKAALNGVRYFSSLGAVASTLMVLGREEANDREFIRDVPWASMVYFTGGSPDHLLSTLQGSALLNHLIEALDAGAVIGGSSAGAMVMGSLIRSPSSLEWAGGLGLVPELAVLPHHENSDPPMVARDLAKTVPPEMKVLGIDARTCVFGTPGRWRVLGVGNVTTYRDGSWATFGSGESLPKGW